MSKPVDIEKRVGQYIKLRAKIKEIEDKHKEELKPYKEMLDTLNGILLNALNAGNQDSATAKGVGTVYRKTRTSVSIADHAAFQRHVIGAQDFDLLDWKANSTAVQAFLAEHNTLPPGLNITTMVDVGVRKA